MLATPSGPVGRSSGHQTSAWATSETEIQASLPQNSGPISAPALVSAPGGYHLLVRLEKGPAGQEGTACTAQGPCAS